MFKKINNIRKSFTLDKNEHEFIKKFTNSNAIDNKYYEEKKIILINLYPDYFSLVNFYLILKEKKFRNCKIVGLWTNQIFIKKNIFRYFVEILLNYFRFRKWKKLYSIIGVDKIYITNVNLIPYIFYYFFKKYFLFKKIVNKKKFLDYKYRSIKVGDLIYDTYLRFFEKTTLDTADNFNIQQLNFILVKLFNTIKSIKKKYQIMFFFSALACYFQHGLYLRYFLNRRIICYGGKNFTQYIKQYKSNSISHKDNFFQYNSNFKKIINKQMCINLSKKLLKKRFEGKLGKQEFYMKNSAFSKNIVKLKKIDCIIFLPDFVDSPHIRTKLIFYDFHDWIIKTLDYLKKKNYNKENTVAIKPHPNSKFSNVQFQNKLRKIYPDFYWIAESISNKSIYEQKPYFGLSPDGTPIIEMSYKKVRAISSGTSPYCSFNFFYTPKNQKEYFKYIDLGFQKKLTKKINLNDVYASFYMYNLYNNDCMNNLSREIDLRSLVAYAEKSEFLNKSKILIKKII
jgi:hypothetical protein